MVSSTDDEHEITKRVAKRLPELLAGGGGVPTSKPLLAQQLRGE